MIRPHPTSTLFPYTTLFRSDHQREDRVHDVVVERSSTARLVCPALAGGALDLQERALLRVGLAGVDDERSEEHTSELQSHSDLVCRLLLEKKKQKKNRS